jgi:hypothetical protein
MSILDGDLRDVTARFMKRIQNPQGMSVCHSCAQEVETYECHQIVTKTGAKRTKIEQIQKQKSSLSWGCQRDLFDISRR